jgi:hypothetical protein
MGTDRIPETFCAEILLPKKASTESLSCAKPFCLVEADLHARSYIYDYTFADQPNGGTVFENMVAFLEPAMD